MQAILKRIGEAACAAALLVLLAPLLLAIVLAIRLSSRGPVLFRQQRAGRGGRAFSLYKFRTMRLHVDPYGPSPRSDTDPRLTRVGKWLREYSLDELPQLANIVKGDMSFIGPRPLYVSQITEWNERQKQRLLVKPGLTGLAQVSGRGALTREEKLELDVVYVEQRGLRMNARICAATIAQLLGRRNVYEKRYSISERVRGERVSKQQEQTK